MSLSPQTPGAGSIEPAERNDASARSQASPSERQEELDAVIGRIATNVAKLEHIAKVPLAEHAEVYQHLHAHLQAELADIDGRAQP